ncbi:hypothetical protein G7062_09325 [Erysipelothrix sp. HDW6C]|uniref:hypothetical protein n=1 Tax=Erysipelothrix sp. HDW6C TaxID=2714930 RepID=UPI00140A6E09|nr:hypothetical protein [Erysipelothrix sp. HDW6C]QIK70490.1 hypothetical protein G7062_09325 [Erysipelothrix sp. HDW6C]
MFGRKRKKKLLTEDEITEKFKDVEFEKNDALAISLAALITFLPVVLLISAVLIAIVWIIF